MAFASWLCAAWLKKHTTSMLTMAIIDSGVLRPIMSAMAPATEEAATKPTIAQGKEQEG